MSVDHAFQRSQNWEPISSKKLYFCPKFYRPFNKYKVLSVSNTELAFLRRHSLQICQVRHLFEVKVIFISNLSALLES